MSEDIKKELQEIKEKLDKIEREAIKIEQLEEYAQSSNFPSLIAVILLQLFTIFLIGWIMYKGGYGF